MKRGVLTRYETGDDGTFGILADDAGFKVHTIELPWRDNAKGESCIPDGTYTFRWRTDSPKHGECYEMVPDAEAPGRTNVQIHSANFAGDVAKGKKCQLLGCIAPGKSVGVLEGQKAVLDSKAAIRALADNFNRESFELVIRWEEGLPMGGDRG